ncbi:MAG: four helix bundle protein [Bacteroidaceae bacterium]|nr:four helix bundle protein [Bacteroidaceae bacterium]
MHNNVILEKSFDFSVRIVNLKKYLNSEKKECIMAAQLMRSGTSIGANVTEADQAQSKADFISKISIANKEAHETRYWLRLLHRTDYLNDEEFSSIISDCQELIKILQAIIKSAKDNNQ